ncbi:MAG TPA: NAD(P)-dependent oxidoreductase, partial [Thermoanaerobaculia bacterium]|nr:NAD(P)-dependent oxidoreductase [Thermoanaerobaculia bacterium]
MPKSFPYYPIFIDVENHDVVIIGGGDVCARQAEGMMRYGARVTIVSPEFTPEIEAWAGDGKLALRRKRY